MRRKIVTLGSRLRYYRKKNNFTQETVSQLVGVSRTAISGYERGSTEPELATLRKLASIYKVSADTLLDIERPDTAVEKKTVKKEIDAATAALKKATIALENAASLLDKL